MTAPERPASTLSIRNRYLALSDLVFLVGGLFLAYCLRFESLSWAPIHTRTFEVYLLVSVPLKLLVFYSLGLYRRLWESAGSHEYEQMLLASVVSALVSVVIGGWALTGLGLVTIRVPLSVLAVDAAMTAAGLALPRILPRLLRHRLFKGAAPEGDTRRVLIAGAGAAGELLARQLRVSSELGLVPIGFVDDDLRKHRQQMHGLKVLGGLDQISVLHRAIGFDEVIVAMPSAPGTVVRAVLRRAASAGVPARTVPGLTEILSGRVSVSALRPIQIEDLLRREPVSTDLEQVEKFIRGRVVLVTGAGGSIGSELCRQVASFGPSRLILLGHGENSIYGIHGELDGWPGVGEVVPVVADIRDRHRMFEVMSRHAPAIVFHAAAHKHVPLMEWNVREAVTNNVLGTRTVVEAALAAGTDHLVLISTDKAVRPTSVMGATKRVAEQLVQDTGEGHARNFISVRFGNVLGSRGSVVPSFLRQIERGGPVTVTHPEMRRYFMTIPEAVQLVLQAAVLGRGGDVFVLDMGEPIRIVDLARDLIRLSGLEIGRDIEIKFTGVRPGEKLYEELFFGAEMAIPTEHPKVLRARHESLPATLSASIDGLIEASRTGSDAELRARLLNLVPDYAPEVSPGNLAALKSERQSRPLP